jgi:hypothetical protein
VTDARFPEKWLSDRRIQRLSDAHFRAFITSLAWSVSNRTDGVIEREDLQFIPQFAPGAPKALLADGLWTPRSNGWRITDFVGTQTTAAVLKAMETKREKERVKKALQRSSGKNVAADDDSDPVDLDVPGDIPRDIPRDGRGDVAGGHKGQASARQAQGTGEESLPLAAGAESWPRWQGEGPDPFAEHN